MYVHVCMGVLCICTCASVCMSLYCVSVHVCMHARVCCDTRICTYLDEPELHCQTFEVFYPSMVDAVQLAVLSAAALA